MDNERTSYDKIKSQHPDWSLQDTTKRIKKVEFEKQTSADLAILETLNLWEGARLIYNSPLVQLRVVLDMEEEGRLLGLADYLNSKNKIALKGGGNLRVNGRLPFANGSKNYGIYYIQAESQNRLGYIDTRHIGHNEAVQKGIQKRAEQNYKQELPEGYVVRALDFTNGSKDVLTNQEVCIDPERLAESISNIHKLAFQFPHDPAQQTKEGVLDILMNNPTLVCFDPYGKVVSVGFMERDSRFTFSDAVLVEPTYFTKPGESRKGLSSHIRQATRELVTRHGLVDAYKGKPMIVFNESIRHTSFVLCLENNCELAGTEDLKIDGNLGEAYTAIGPASPDKGFMPMGLTYYISPEIKIQ